MAAETAIVDNWLYTTLSGDATLIALVGTRDFVFLAPPFTSLPCVTFGYLPGGEDIRALDNVHALSKLFYEIKAVGEGNNIANLKPIGDRLDALLSGVVADLSAARLRVGRDSPVERSDVLAGTTRHCHLGGVYRIWCSPKY